MDFDRVVIKNVTQQKHNVHIAVHPFKSAGLRMMMRPGDYDETGDEYKGAPIPEWQRGLADSLWERIPGLHTLFFGNGQITIQHAGIFDDEDIIEAAAAILQPVLQAQLLLESL